MKIYLLSKTGEGKIKYKIQTGGKVYRDEAEIKKTALTFHRFNAFIGSY